MSIEPSSLRVVDLRKELSSRGLPTGGKKSVLIKRLTKVLAKEEPTENTTDVTASTDNLNDKPQNDLNIATTDGEKLSEVTSSEQKAESIHEEKLVDKPAEETNEKNIEPLPTQNLTDKSAEITNEQKVELTQDPTEKLIKEVIKEDYYQVIEEPVANTALPQESTLEKPIDIVINTDTVQVEVAQQPAEEPGIVNQQQQQQLSAESLIQKPQKQPIQKPQEQLIEKQSFEQLIERPFDQSFDQLMERPMESFIEQPQEELDEHRNVDSMRSREQMVTPPRDDEEIKMSTNIFASNDGFKTQDSMAFDADIGVKRKANEELHEEPDKRQKTTIADNDNLKCIF